MSGNLSVCFTEWRSSQRIWRILINIEDKAELRDAFGSFCSGMMAAFERDYPALKKSFHIRKPRLKGLKNKNENAKNIRRNSRKFKEEHEKDKKANEATRIFNEFI